MNHIEKAISQAAVIEIVSGEGEMGTVEIFTGKKTALAISRRIKKEKCGGQRFCYARVDGERIYLTEKGLQF